ncbi:hypothetical protein Enr17x_23770 [Gimesia fumaroli]|uniref:Uncharacterized protein n=1 Tax=Gimesia fumaroli TaxID=2527976 RepID=A0A518IBB7_9PLAN|nr:hypothetical protein Enr17x_23770 [Gimesia fumaroli]
MGSELCVSLVIINIHKKNTRTENTVRVVTLNDRLNPVELGAA